jgi:hypothetical protein
VIMLIVNPTPLQKGVLVGVMATVAAVALAGTGVAYHYRRAWRKCGVPKFSSPEFVAGVSRSYLPNEIEKAIGDKRLDAMTLETMGEGKKVGFLYANRQAGAAEWTWTLVHGTLQVIDPLTLTVVLECRLPGVSLTELPPLTLADGAELLYEPVRFQMIGGSPTFKLPTQ